MGQQFFTSVSNINSTFCPPPPPSPAPLLTSLPLSRQWTEMAGTKSKTVAPTFSKPPYQLTYQQVADELGTSTENGLSQQQVEANTTKYGENKLEGEGAISPWKILFKQMANAMYVSPPSSEFESKHKERKTVC